MKSSIQNYLLDLLKSGPGLQFVSFTCRYGKFTMYCLIGPEENIMQVTFAPEKHQQLQNDLKSLNRKVFIGKQQQKRFPFNSMFADYFAGRLTEFPVEEVSPLIAAGTDFQKSVWHHIGKILYGGCITYKTLAELAGSPGGARAVGMACGANPLALIIPCHRVVAVNGLGGFAGGVAIKEALLTLEGTVSNIVKNNSNKEI